MENGKKLYKEPAGICELDVDDLPYEYLVIVISSLFGTQESKEEDQVFPVKNIPMPP
jgi:hypothetical protein